MIHAELTLQVQCSDTTSSELAVLGTNWELIHLGSGGCSQLVPGDLCPRSGMLEGVKHTWWCFPFPRHVLQPVSLQGKLLLEALIQILELAVVVDCPSSTPQQGGKCDNISPCEITAVPLSARAQSEPSLPPSPSLRLFLGSQHEIFLLKPPVSAWLWSVPHQRRRRCRCCCSQRGCGKPFSKPESFAKLSLFF